MASSPPPLTPWEQRKRRRYPKRRARKLGFVGRVEYRHAYSNTGGASFRQGVEEPGYLLTVYAEAFEHDANPEAFSLRAIIAHERGHQILMRHPRIAPRVAGRISRVSEEILASIVGAMICGPGLDHSALVGKALVELLSRGLSREEAVRQFDSLWALFEVLL